MIKRIGIIGANGFVGKNLVKELWEKEPQYKIIAFTYPEKDKSPKGVSETKRLDVLDKKSLEQLLGIDTLIYLVKGSPEVIVQGLQNVLEEAERFKIKKIIYLSSIVVFGEPPYKGAGDDSPLDVNQKNPYNLAKIRAEEIVNNFRKRGFLNIIIIRPGYVYGEGGLDHTIYFLQQVKDGFKKFFLPEKGKGIFNGIYVKNLTHLIVSAFKSKVNNENFNGLDGYGLSWYELFKAYAEILNKNIDSLLNNKKAVVIKRDIFSGIIKKLFRKFFPNKIFISKQEYNLYSSDYQLRTDKAERLLNYNPSYSFEQAIKNIKNWIRANPI